MSDHHDKNEPADRLKGLLNQTLQRTALPGLPEPVHGKVRDVYDLGTQLLIVTTDRISAFDVVLGTVPMKGQVLNAIAAHWFSATADVVPNHMVTIPDPCAMLVKKLTGVDVEVVVRRYLTGSLWRDYESGQRDVYGQTWAEGLKNNQRFDTPMVTPTTKAERGQHDQPISEAEIIERGLVEPITWARIREMALALFARGEAEAQKRGLILVDTKYEFGLDGDDLYVMDEIHTPDSSRYWEAALYEERFAAGLAQKMLDKENIRQWLLERGYQGEGPPPALTDEIRLTLARTYLGLQERLTGMAAEPVAGDANERLMANLKSAGIA